MECQDWNFHLLEFHVITLIARREGDSNPRYGYPYGSLANCWFQPLTHLSVSSKMKTASIAGNPAQPSVFDGIFQLCCRAPWPAERGCKYRTTFCFRKIFVQKMRTGRPRKHPPCTGMRQSGVLRIKTIVNEPKAGKGMVPVIVVMLHLNQAFLRENSANVSHC